MTNKDQWHELLLTLVLITGGVALIIFPIIYAIKGDWPYVIIEGVCGVFMWLSLLFVKKTHNYFWPSIVGYSGVVVIVSVLLFNGGLADTGLIWWGLLPITSIILFGNKAGIKALLIGLFILLSISTLGTFGLFPIKFSIFQISQAIALVAIISTIMYFYEKVASSSRNEAEEKAKLLEEQITLKQSAEARLFENLSTLQKEKEKQLNVRSAMLNLLEDDRELEKQITEEKANVEKKVIERTQELTNTKAKLDSSIENLPLGFLMTDVEENFIVSNTLANEFLKGKDGKENLEILKRTLKERVDLNKYIKNCSEERKRLTFSDIQMGGRFFQFLLSPILTKDSDNVCIGIVALIQDVTEAKILDRSKDEFFSIASHELRTPLTAIRGNTSMILEYYADAIKDPELKSMINDVHDSSIRLINIVNDFLNVSRLEQQRMVYDISEFEIDKLIPETIKEYDVTGSRKKISIDYLPSDSPIPEVRGDKDKVRQILINLLGNSLKFTEHGGINIKTEVKDKFVKVIVSDTGRGIPLVQQSLLFHKFQQAGDSLFTRDTAGGSGLGLYISKMMIEGMGGTIQLEKSEEGKGTTFSFCIPIATEENKSDRLKKLNI